MSNGVTFEIPESEKRKLFEELNRKMKYTKETLAEATNHAAQNLAFQALKETDKANADQIAYVLGQTGQALQYSKKGKMLKSSSKFKNAIFKDDSLAARIINSRLKSAGKPLLFGPKMLEAVRKYVAYRKRSAGFVASGWIKSIRDISRFTKTPIRFSSEGARQYGLPKGYGIPAKEISFVNEAIICNTATKDDPKAAAIAQAGLTRAVGKVVADIRVYIERKMQEAMKK